MSKKQKHPSYASLHALLLDALDSICFGEDGLACYPTLGSSESRLAVVYGENASGKSFFTTVARAFLGDLADIREELFSVSMRNRTREGMHRMFMYPDESDNSTGAVSLHATFGTFQNARNRKHPVWIVLDEPDTGLSDRYAAGMGAYLAQEMNTLPKHIKGVLLISHSRPLLRKLREELHIAPHEIGMGEQQSLAEYLDPANLRPASVDELQALPTHACELRRKLNALLST